MGADYIPERDLRASCWMKNFARRLMENPSAYRTTVEEAEQIDTVVLAFRTAMTTAWPMATRSRVTVRRKNAARKAAEQLIRPTAQRIRTDPQITSELKLRIGLNPRAKRRRTVPIPQSMPTLQLIAANSGLISIRVSDSQSHRRARPKEAIGLQLYQRIIPREAVDPRASDTPVDTNQPLADQSQYPWRFIGMYTRTPITLVPGGEQEGDLMSLAARWVNRKGEVTHFGPHRSIRVPFGRMLMNGTGVRDLRRNAA